MRWRLTISDNDPKKQPSSVIVAGKDWFTAFEAGLKRQPPGVGLVGGLECVLYPGNILKIIDNLSRRNYDLRPVDAAGFTRSQTESISTAGEIPGRAVLSPALGADTISAFERMQAVTAFESRHQVAEFGLSLAMQLIRCQTGLCMLQTSAKKELCVAAKQGQSADLFPAQPVDVDVGFVGFALRMGAVVTVSRSESDPLPAAEYHAPSTYAVADALCAPLQFEGRTSGAMFLLNRLKESGFSPSDSTTLSYLTGALAEYMEKKLPGRNAGLEENGG